MTTDVLSSRAAKFYQKVLAWPKTTIALFILTIGVCASFIPRIKMDTTIESYINDDNEALITRNKVRETFGLSDPIVIAVENPKGVFNPRSLNIIAQLSSEVEKIKGVNPEKIFSISTEKNIYGTSDGMMVEPFYEEKITLQSEADKVKKAVLNFPLYKGNLVSEDGTMALIVVELTNFKNETEIYKQFEEVAKKHQDTYNKIHIAGIGAVNSYLSKYIEQDAQFMAPVALMVLTITLLVTFRTLRGMLLPNMIVIASLLCAIGLMVAAGIPFYTLSNVIPVIIIVVSVAGAMHIMGQYYEEAALNPLADSREIVIRTMAHMWKPVVATTVTNFASFLSMTFTESSPPLRAVGIWSSVGLAFALLFSLVLPVCLALIKPKRSKAYKLDNGHNLKIDFWGSMMGNLGKVVSRYPKTVLGVFVALSLVAIIGINKLQINDNQVDNFQRSEPIRVADMEMNAKMNGTNAIDVMIETPSKEGLYSPEVLQEIEKFQEFAKALPNVKGAVSIVDVMKQMNKSLNENDQLSYILPDKTDQAAQYFLLYSASADPSDFANYVDYDYRLANIRIQMTDGHYAATKPVMEKINEYIKTIFSEKDKIKASVGGWVNVHYTWINNIEKNHFTGVFLAMFLIWVLSSYFFRSLSGGLFAMIPVALAIYSVYALMGFTNTWLSVATSMSAAIASGDAIDFSIHTIDRIKHAIKNEGKTIDEALEALYPTTGRVLFFNFIAIAFGFGAMFLSKIPPLSTFCLLLVICIASCFVISMTLLPALLKTFKPKFLFK